MTFHRVAIILILASPSFAAPLPKELRNFAEAFPGSTWRCVDSFGTSIYTFEKDGRLTYSRGPSCWRNGTWKFENGEITWECNNRYAEFGGTYKDGVITGKARNKDGVVWDMTYTLDKDVKHPCEPNEMILQLKR